MKLKLFFLLMWGLGSLCAQPNIVYGEYFMDVDPGRGNGFPFPAFTPGDSVSMSATLNPSDWSVGLHILHARVQDADQVWSHRLYRPILLLPAEVAPIDQVEYFWGQDPGQGNGQPPTVTYSTADSLDLTWSMDIDTLPPGIHELSVRAKNIQGVWSQAVSQTTLIQAFPEAPIQQLDYDFRWEPDSQTITYTYPLAQPQQIVEVSFDPVVDDLVNSGTYTLCITALTTDSLRSFERCADFSWQGDSTGDTTATAIGQFQANQRWQVYPNPTQDFVRLSPADGSGAPFFVTLATASGQTLLRRRFLLTPNEELQLDLRPYAAGSYLLIVEQGPQIHAINIRKN